VLETEVQLHPFLISTVDARQWLASSPGRFAAGQSGLSEEEKPFFRWVEPNRNFSAVQLVT